jgi:hypothetical protein
MGEPPLDKSFLALYFFGKMAARVLCSSSKNWTIEPIGSAIAAQLVV